MRAAQKTAPRSRYPLGTPETWVASHPRASPHRVAGGESVLEDLQIIEKASYRGLHAQMGSLVQQSVGIKYLQIDSS